MLINTRKILASIGLLIAMAGGPILCFGQSTYTLVTSENDLVAGEAYIIVGKSGSNYKAMGYQKDNNRHAVAVDVNESNQTITTTCATEASEENTVYEFVLGGGKGNWTFYDNTRNAYLYAASSSNNYLRSIGIILNNYNALWTIKIGTAGIDTITAKGENTNNDLRYYSSKSLFSCYAYTSTTGSYVYLYKKNTEPIIDENPPTFSTNYPIIENITKNSFDLKVKTDEPCTVFYRVVAEGEAEPLKDELLASGSTISVENKNTEYTATVTGLEPETNYNVYLIAKDTADNVQDNITTITATTLSAFVKIIALGAIEEKYYWGETATISWTTNIDATTDKDSILIFKGNKKILCHSIDITSGEADIRIGNGTAPDGDTYATNYSLKVVSGNVESELSANFTIVPTITINRLLTDTTDSGSSVFNKDIVRMKGLVTGVKTKALTIQDGMGDFCAIYITNNPNTSVEMHDSVCLEVAVSQSSNGIIKTTTKQVTVINKENQPQTPRITELSEINANNGLKYLVVKVKGVTNVKKIFYKDNDSICYVNTLFVGSNNYFIENRKYDISGVLNIGTDKLEIWPRSQMPEDFYLYSNNSTLAELTIGGRDAMNSDTLYFRNLTNVVGIEIATNDPKSTVSIRLNNSTIATDEWQNMTFAPLDSVFVTITAEDGATLTRRITLNVIATETLSISNIRRTFNGKSPYDGKFITTEGVVTHIVTTTKGTELYIQDSAGMWSGIMVVDECNQYAATLAVGDRIKVSGIVEENFGMARIGQIEALTVLNSDIKVHTDTIIVEDARSVAYQNALVTIDSVVCTGGFENLFTVQDSTNSIIVYNKYKFNDFALEIDSMYRITGIIYYTSADGSYRLIPRSADDIVKLVRPAKPVIEPKPETPKPDPPQPQEPDTTTVSVIDSTAIGLNAYTANRAIMIENATSAVSVFDIAGRLIATARPAPRIVINAPHTGIYIVRTRQNAIKVAVE